MTMEYGIFQSMNQCVEKTYQSIQLGFRTTSFDGMLEEHCFSVATRKFKQSLPLGHLQEKHTYSSVIKARFPYTHVGRGEQLSKIQVIRY